MKVAVVGVGNVGTAVFHELQQVNTLKELTLVGRNAHKVEAEVMDAKDAAVARQSYSPKLTGGAYESVAGADIIVYTAGSAKMKSDRMEMAQDNCDIVEEIFGEIKRYNRDAIILCVTNPLDVITMKIRQVMEGDPHRVIGTGTLLESARVLRFVAEFLEISDRSIQMSVVGEHGASAVTLLSSVRVMGLSLEEYVQSVTDESLRFNAKRLDEAFKKAAYRIFNGKGYTSTGVAATVFRLVSAISTDAREILPVSSVLQGEYGVHGVAASVPSIVGRNGIEEIREVVMTEEERESFLASVDKIRQVGLSVGIL